MLYRGHAALTGFYLAYMLTLTGCMGDLQKFLDEDKPLMLTVVSDTTATPTYSVRNGTISFSITLQVDRTANYSILHGASCSANHHPAGVPVTGSLAKNSPSAIAVSILLSDISTFGHQVTVCVADVAAYRKASTTISFANALSYLDTLNEQNGGGLTADAMSGFQIFQPNATSSDPNRLTTPASNSANRPYQHAIYVDRNDGYKMKYFVVDQENHRILIFTKLPTDNSAAADVVVGQTNFNSMIPNAGGTTNKLGFDHPTYVCVTNDGKMLVADRRNHRVLIFNTIPTSNGATADFVIGQPNMNIAIANNLSLPTAARLHEPGSVQVINGKLYISDRNNHRIVVFNSIPASNGASADFVIGQPDLSTFSPGTDYSDSSFLNHPYEIHIYDARLYLVDADNNRVLVFDPVPTASDERPDFVIGQSDPAGNEINQGGGPAANTLKFPVSVGVYSGRLVIADQDNHRLLFYTLPITGNNAAATHVMGQPNMTTATAGMPASATNYHYPKSLVFDKGYIWIADQFNHRIQVMQAPF